MKKTGVFYEIGAFGAYSAYLSDDNWKEESQSLENKGQDLLVPLKYTTEYDRWAVYMIEPLARNMRFMQDHVPQHHPKVKLIQAAIGSHNGIQVLDSIDIGKYNKGEFGTDHTASHQKTNMFTWQIKPDFQFYTYVLTLDKLFHELSAWPTVLRIDIEGAEADVLNAYSFNPKPRIIQVDTHDINREACRAILEAHGYNILDDEWGDYKKDIYAELK